VQLEKGRGPAEREKENQRQGVGGAAAAKNGEESDGFRVFLFRVFLYFFLMLSKLPPLCLSCGPVFIGKMLHGSQNWSLNFLSFFVNLIFLNFFVFFENEQYQRRLNEENQ
jgi:hypothetical protein